MAKKKKESVQRIAPEAQADSGQQEDSVQQEDSGQRTEDIDPAGINKDNQSATVIPLPQIGPIVIPNDTDKEKAPEDEKTRSDKDPDKTNDTDKQKAPEDEKIRSDKDPDKTNDTDKEKHEPVLSEVEGKKESVAPTPKWHFPDARRCPRCKGTNTEAYHTDVKKGRQYRRCRAPICRWKYSVNGRRTGG
jgi:hypothetical protein